MKRFTLLRILVATAALFSINITAGHGADQTVLSGNHPVETQTLASLGNADFNQTLTMEIRFALRNTIEIDRLLTEQQDPSSPNYHQWLKTGEFDRRFGPRPADIKAVADWLTSEGFTIEPASDGYLKFTGNVGQAQHSFAVRIARFGDGSTYANVEDPMVPAQFAGMIGAITGLDNMVHIKPIGLHRVPPTPSVKTLETLAFYDRGAAMDTSSSTQAVSTRPFAIVDGVESFGPQDMRTFYDETVQSGSDGTGSCIAMVGLSEVSAGALNAFDSQFGLPPNKLTDVVQGKNPGQTGDDFELEAELDVEWSHAIAPGATQKLFVASPGDADPLAEDITSAVKDNQCSVISISFGYCGAPGSEFTNVLDPLFKKAAAQGQSVFVSSGDQGAAGLDSQCNPTGSRGVNEMSADPYVTSVGGTQSNPNFDQNGNDLGYAQESAWNTPGDASEAGASGGGVSAVFPKPSYQSGPGVPSDSNRDVPDVALQASPSSPGAFFGDAVLIKPPQVTCCIGGTSLSAPMMAGFVSVLGQQAGRLGSMNPIYYKLANQQYGPAGTASGFHDITTGNNNFQGVTGFNAGPAYDQVTGWGSIDFDVFAAAVLGNVPPATTSMVPTPPQINFGNVDAGGSSKPHKVSLVNKGAVAATIGTVIVPAGFKIAPGTDLCSNQSIAPKKSCTLMLQFAPRAVGVVSESVSIPYNAAVAATVSVSGNGTAVSLKKPAAVAFAPVVAGLSGLAKSVTITNPSTTATVQLSACAISGPFTPASDTCSNARLGPKAHCVTSLRFAPPMGSLSKTAMGGNLNFGFSYGSNNGAATVSLSGTVK